METHTDMPRQAYICILADVFDLASWSIFATMPLKLVTVEGLLGFPASVRADMVEAVPGALACRKRLSIAVDVACW